MSDNTISRIEYSEEDKKRFAKIMRANYNERSITDYLELGEYLQSKTKHLSKSDRATEKLKNQALTYMQSVMNSEKRRSLPKGVLADVAKNGDKFIEKFGYDADGAINPVSRKFKEWLIQNKAHILQMQINQNKTAVEAPLDKVVANSKADIKAGMKAGAIVLGTMGAAYGLLTTGPVGALACGITGAVGGSMVIPVVAKIESAIDWLSSKFHKSKKKEKKSLEKAKNKAQEKENKNGLDKVVANSKADIKAGMKAGAIVLGTMGAAYGLLTTGPVGALACGITGAVGGSMVIPVVAKIESAIDWLSSKFYKSKKSVHVSSLQPQTLEQVKGRMNDKVANHNMDIVKDNDKSKKSNNIRKRAVYKKDNSRAI